MKKFYIVANPDKENTKNMQAAIEKYLKAHGAGVSVGKACPDMEIRTRIRRRYLRIPNVSSRWAGTEP